MISLMQLGLLNIFICSLFGILISPLVNKVGKDFKMLDIPEARKINKKTIVRIGGLTIFLTFFIYIFVFLKFFDVSLINNFDNNNFLTILDQFLIFFLVCMMTNIDHPDI